MKTYNVMFRATVDCSMYVTLDDDEDLNYETFLSYVQEDCHRNCHVDDWVEPDDKPTITIEDWEEAE